MSRSLARDEWIARTSDDQIVSNVTACKLALTTRALDYLTANDGADFLRAARAFSLHFPPIQRVADVSERIEDLSDIPDAYIERMKAIRDAAVFALFHLLGLSFAPRLRDFPDRRLACFGRPGRGKELAPLMGKPINEEVVLEHWNDALRLTASIKTVSVTPSAMLRKLGAYRQQNRLYLALGEIGRIERTLFMLDWMESPPT